MKALELLKNTLAPSPSPSPDDAVEAAKARLASAQRKLEKVQTEQRAKVQAERERFNADQTEAAADAVVHVTARAEVLIDAARQLVIGAESEVSTAEQAAHDAQIAKFDATRAALRARVTAVADTARPHVAALLEICHQHRELLQDAARATNLREQLTGDKTAASAARMELDIATLIPRTRIREVLKPGDWAAICELLGVE